MHIRVFGTGCSKCAEAEKLMQSLVDKLGIEATVEKVSDLKEMMQAGVMSTPAVALDGVVKCTGRVPSVDEATAWLRGKDEPAGAGGCCCGGTC